MRKWTVRAARTALVTAAIAGAGAGIANADDNTRGDHSLLGGEQIPITAPITAPVTAPITAPILNGTQLNLLNNVSLFRRSGLIARDDTDQPKAAPATITICGNAVSTPRGLGTAACKGRATQTADNESDAAPVLAPSACTPCAAPAPASASIAEPATAPEPPAPVPAAHGMIGAPAEEVGAPGSPVMPKAADAAPIAHEAAPVVKEAPATDEAPVATDEAPIATDETAPIKKAASEAPAAAPVRTPINICGNAGALGGVATAACEGTASNRKLGGHPMHVMGLIGVFG